MRHFPWSDAGSMERYARIFPWSDAGCDIFPWSDAVPVERYVTPRATVGTTRTTFYMTGHMHLGACRNVRYLEFTIVTDTYLCLNLLSSQLHAFTAVFSLAGQSVGFTALALGAICKSIELAIV